MTRPDRQHFAVFLRCFGTLDRMTWRSSGL